MRCKRIACAIAVIAASVVPAMSRDLTITSPGGVYSEMMEKHFFKPFAKKEGINYFVQQGSTRWGQIQAIIDTNQRPWDLIETEVYEHVRACDEGLLKKLDLDAMGLADAFNESAVFGCGVGVGITAIAIAYPNGKFPTPPATVEDYFDLEKFPGKRGIRATAKYAVELGLLADGVKPDELYKVLATDEGVDRAFAKLNTIKSSLLYWETGAQALQLISGGDAVMTTAYSHRVALEANGGLDLGIIWDRSFLNHDVFGVIGDAENAEVASRFLEFYADPEREAAFIKEMPMGPALAKTIELLPPDLVKMLPVGDNLDGAIDAGTEEALSFWLDNGDRITKRWDAWRNN